MTTLFPGCNGLSLAHFILGQCVDMYCNSACLSSIFQILPNICLYTYFHTSYFCEFIQMLKIDLHSFIYVQSAYFCLNANFYSEIHMYLFYN